ncbi:UNVERIFIED_CONTAM: hypothetical protein K2H54_065443 [Gekko kuhli]
MLRQLASIAFVIVRAYRKELRVAFHDSFVPATAREVLELSLFEMKNTAAELEKRLNNMEDEDNEWKTRYETQIELNRQLERQIGLFQGKMQHVCGNPTDRLASVRSFDQMHLGQLELIPIRPVSLGRKLKWLGWWQAEGVWAEGNHIQEVPPAPHSCSFSKSTSGDAAAVHPKPVLSYQH